MVISPWEPIMRISPWEPLKMISPREWNFVEWKVIHNDKKIKYSLHRIFKIIFLLTTKASVIRDSSDSNPNIFYLMWLNESRSALFIENMEFLLPAGTALSLTFYIILVETLSVVGSIFDFTGFFDIVSCQHSLTLIITAKQPSVRISFRISLHMTSAHMYTTFETIMWMLVNYTVSRYMYV